MTSSLLLWDYFAGKRGAGRSVSCEVADPSCGNSETPCTKGVFLSSRRAGILKAYNRGKTSFSTVWAALFEVGRL